MTSWIKICRYVEDDFKILLKKLPVNSLQDFFNFTTLEIAQLTGCGLSKAISLQQVVAIASSPPVHTALHLRKRQTFLHTSLKCLDKALGGGLPCASITEISAPAGCGKTQFCLQLSVQAHRKAREQGEVKKNILFIDTEGTFVASRLIQLAEDRYPDEFSDETSVDDLAAAVIVMRPENTHQLTSCLQHLTELIVKHSVCFVVVDSVARPVRADWHASGTKSLSVRGEHLASQAASLKLAAEQFNIPVVVTNQVTSRFKKKDGSQLDNRSEPVSYVTSALGCSWAHYVNTRLLLQYGSGKKASLGDVRRLTVLKSPLVPVLQTRFSITSAGLEVHDDDMCVIPACDPSLFAVQQDSDLPHDHLFSPS